MGIPLHVHSSYTPLGGLCHPRELVSWAKENALETLALTDTNGFYGMHFFLESCREEGIRPIIGTEIIWENNRLVILLTSKTGYQIVCRMITEMNFDKMNKELFKEMLLSLSGDSVIFTDQKNILTFLRPHYSKDRLYFEATPGFFNHQDVLWAKSKNIPLLASTRSRYINPDDHFYFYLIQAIKNNTTLSALTTPHYNSGCRLYSPLEFTGLFTPYPEAIKNTYKVAEMAQIDWTEEEIIFPEFSKMSEKECDRALFEKCQKGIHLRYNEPDPALYNKVMKRLEHELQVICSKGFSSYFLVVEDIVRNSPRTCGRGSAASSLVSYLLFITHVDPIKHNLFFDRFLNPARTDPPDIDIDFPWDERDYILEYVFNKYPGHAAMVANHNTIQGRSSLREVAKVFGIPTEEINFIAKRFPRVELNKVWKTIIFHAQKLQNLFQTLSVHPGGVVITPRAIDTYVPLQLTPKGVPVIQWEKRQTKKAKLVKIDLLGNRSLAVIRDCIKSVNINYSKNYLYQNLNPLVDEKTRKLICEGKTMGVFYIESPASRQLLERMNTWEFENIVIASSIIRPAANKYSNEFVERLHGKSFRHLHPLLKPILDETYGIMVYQEQVTMTAMALADFSSAEGNNLRKVLDKKEKKKKLADYKEQFYEGAQKKGISLKVLDMIWEMILSFSGYSFCKAHSASYAMVSYKSSYLKANYPAEFMAAVISNRGGFYSPFAYLDEARRMNIKILPPDVNYSEYEYKGRENTIRAGLMQIVGLKKKLSELIVKEKNKETYKDLKDFLNRVEPTFDDAKILVKSRSLGSLRFGVSYSEQMWQVYAHFAGLKGMISKNVKKVLPGVSEYNPQRIINWELGLLGGGVSFPEWALYKRALKIEGRTQARNLKDHIGKEVLLFGLYVTSKRVYTKNKEHMSFVTFSDETGLIESVLFPGVYLAFRDLLNLEDAFLIKGKVEETLGSIQLNIFEIEKVGSPPNS